MGVFQRDNGCVGGEEQRYRGSDVARVDGGWVEVSWGCSLQHPESDVIKKLVTAPHKHESHLLRHLSRMIVQQPKYGPNTHGPGFPTMINVSLDVAPLTDVVKEKGQGR